MTAASSSAAGAHRQRLLAERTRLLAARGRTGTESDAALPDHLVCSAGPHLAALSPRLVAEVRATAFHAVPFVLPAASHAMLGVFNQGGLPYSLLELSRLLEPAGPAAPDGAGGRMLLLRRTDRRRVALRVDAVLGLPALRPAGDGRHALLPDDRLAVLLDAAFLRVAIDTLDDPARCP